MKRVCFLNKGFTLIEAMVATVILSLGTVFIFESFFISLDTYRYYVDYFNVMPWADNKIWDLQNNISSLGPKAKPQTAGKFTQNNTPYTWNVNYELDNSMKPSDKIKLYKIDLVLSCREGQRQVSLKRSAYAHYEE